MIRHVGVVERFLGAGAVVWFYLYKTFVPVHLLSAFRLSAVGCENDDFLGDALCSGPGNDLFFCGGIEKKQFVRPVWVRVALFRRRTWSR